MHPKGPIFQKYILKLFLDVSYNHNIRIFCAFYKILHVIKIAQHGKNKPLVRFIYGFMVASFVQATGFLRSILEITRFPRKNGNTKNLKHRIYILSGCKHKSSVV